MLLLGVVDAITASMCFLPREWGSRLSVVLRDVLVTAPGNSAYERKAC
ncbi:hypothetical protein NKH18_15500 [Streptomyces sp. M10(2022)]